MGKGPRAEQKGMQGRGDHIQGPQEPRRPGASFSVLFNFSLFILTLQLSTIIHESACVRACHTCTQRTSLCVHWVWMFIRIKKCGKSVHRL